MPRLQASSSAAAHGESTLPPRGSISRSAAGASKKCPASRDTAFKCFLSSCPAVRSFPLALRHVTSVTDATGLQKIPSG